MNNQVFNLWKESFNFVSSLYEHAKHYPKQDIVGLRVQLEQLAMEFMNQIAEISTLSKLRGVRLKLSQAQVTSSRISSILSMSKLAYHLDDLRLQMALKTLQVIMGQVQATILVAPAKMSA